MAKNVGMVDVMDIEPVTIDGLWRRLVDTTQERDELRAQLTKALRSLCKPNEKGADLSIDNKALRAEVEMMERHILAEDGTYIAALIRERDELRAENRSLKWRGILVEIARRLDLLGSTLTELPDRIDEIARERDELRAEVERLRVHIESNCIGCENCYESAAEVGISLNSLMGREKE